MPGYNETMLGGMQGLLQMRRMQQMEQQQAWQRQLEEARLRRQYEQMGQQGQIQDRRLQQGLMGLERQNLELQNRMRDQDRSYEQRERLARESMARRDLPPLKPGYRRKLSNPQEMEPVPGGPAWRDLSSKHADDLNRLGSFVEVADAAKATVDRILDPKKKSWGFEPNFGGYNALAAQYLPGPAQDTRNDLENLKSNLKAQGASLMRGVGGAPGSITEREWPILEKMIDSLTPLMSETEAEAHLRRIAQRFEGMKQRSLSNYKQEWGDSPFFKPDPLATQAGGAGTIPEGVDPKVWKYMTPAEKALWQTPR